MNDTYTVLAVCDFATLSRGKLVKGQQGETFTGYPELIEHLFDLGYVTEIAEETAEQE